MFNRALSAAILAALMFGQVAPAMAQWGGPPGYGHGHGPGPEPWEYRHRRPIPPYEVFWIYPAPPPPPGPQVVIVQQQPIQAVPASDPYVDQQGRYCREYQTTVMVGGVAQPSYGTACRMPDGQWRIVR